MEQAKNSFDSIELVETIATRNVARYYIGKLDEKTYLVKELYYDCDYFMDAAKNSANTLDHPNILKFLGTVGDNKIVMEYAGTGNLQAMVKEKGYAPEWKSVLKIATEMCNALSFAHENNHLHGTLTPDSVLFDQDGNVKVDDFNLSKPNKFEMTSTGGFVWDAPEVVNGEACTKASDVFVFGILIWHMVFRGDMPRRTPMLGFGINATPYGAKLPVDCPAGFWKLICDCIETEPGSRPTFDEIRERLATINA